MNTLHGYHFFFVLSVPRPLTGTPDHCHHRQSLKIARDFRCSSCILTKCQSLPHPACKKRRKSTNEKRGRMQCCNRENAIERDTKKTTTTTTHTHGGCTSALLEPSRKVPKTKQECSPTT